MSDAQPSFCKAFNTSVLSNDMIAKCKGGNCLDVSILNRNSYELIAHVTILRPLHNGIQCGNYFTHNCKLVNGSTRICYASNVMNVHSDDLTRLLSILHNQVNPELYRNKFHFFTSLYLSQNKRLPLEIIKYILEFLYL